MERRDEGESAYFKAEEAGKEGYDDFIEEGGKRVRMPYRIVKKLEFTGINADELRDQQNAGRLQYKLMLNDAVIKASVDFAKAKITIIYNPEGAENRREKTNSRLLEEFLRNEGIGVKGAIKSERDYDYYRELYLRSFAPETIRRHAPYGWKGEEWKGERARWERKLGAMQKRKLDAFHRWQEGYAALHGLGKEKEGAT